jgi:hypothetical protein
MPFKLTFRNGLVLYPFHPLRTMAENHQIKHTKTCAAFVDQFSSEVRATHQVQTVEVMGPKGLTTVRDHFDFLGTIPLSAEGVKRRAKLLASREPIKVQKEVLTHDGFGFSLKDVGEIL